MSAIVNVEIRYNCLFDDIQLNTVFPQTATEPLATSYVVRDGIPVLVIEEIIGQITKYEVDLSRRFVSNVTAPHCKIIAYRIFGVKSLKN